MLRSELGPDLASCSFGRLWWWQPALHQSVPVVSTVSFDPLCGTHNALFIKSCGKSPKKGLWGENTNTFCINVGAREKILLFLFVVVVVVVYCWLFKPLRRAVGGESSWPQCLLCPPFSTLVFTIYPLFLFMVCLLSSLLFFFFFLALPPPRIAKWGRAHFFVCDKQM